jgi:hypothetical protein
MTQMALIDVGYFLIFVFFLPQSFDLFGFPIIFIMNVSGSAMMVNRESTRLDIYICHLRIQIILMRRPRM